jgi:hypothetical protein
MSHVNNLIRQFAARAPRSTPFPNRVTLRPPQSIVSRLLPSALNVLDALALSR